MQVLPEAMLSVALAKQPFRRKTKVCYQLPFTLANFHADKYEIEAAMEISFFVLTA